MILKQSMSCLTWYSSRVCPAWHDTQAEYILLDMQCPLFACSWLIDVDHISFPEEVLLKFGMGTHIQNKYDILLLLFYIINKLNMDNISLCYIIYSLKCRCLLISTGIVYCQDNSSLNHDYIWNQWICR